MLEALSARYYQRYANARLLALVIVSLGAFLVPLAISASLIAVPAVSKGLQANAVMVSWIPATFVLASLIAQLPGGRLADLYGRKRIFIIGYVLFALGGALGAVSPNIEFLLFSRVIQGIGGALGTSSGMAILSSIYQSKGRGAALGWMTSSVYFGMTSGPLVGGWMVEELGWRSVFWAPVPLTVLVLLGAIYRIRGEWSSQERHFVDWIGVLLSALALGGIFFGSTHLTSVSGLLLMLLGFFGLYLFHRRSSKIAYPLVRIDLIAQNKTFLRSILAAMFMYASQYGIVFMMALYLQYNRGMTPTEAGQLMMLQAIMMTICAPIAGRLSDRWGSRVLATSGCLIIAVGLGVLVQINDEMSMVVIALSMMAIGLGHGLFSTPNNSAAIGTIPPAKLGIATATLSLARQSGQLLGTAVLSLLIAIYFGGRSITPEGYEDFQSVAVFALAISLAFSLTAAWFSSRKSVTQTQ